MDDNTQTPQDDFYSDDVEAEEIAENSMDPNSLNENEDVPVTSGEMEIGDMDAETQELEKSFDEESVPAGDNVE